MAVTDIDTKPTFLGMLNAIAVGETQAEGYLLAWADTTPNEDFASTLRFVAMREGEHGKAFAKRMLELGYEVRWPESSPDLDDKMACASATDMTDLEKCEKFNVGAEPSDHDIFDGMFADKTIDPITGGLLGRYIAEERDSGRRLRAARLALS